MLRALSEVAASLGLSPGHLVLYGRHAAKIDLAALEGTEARPDGGRLILVSAITPTKAGEGKTTTSIGLTQALQRAGHRAVVALREPSLGPFFGMKGGAAGGGRSQVEPAETLNLHFTGDFHAITAAHNLLAALIDNHLHFGNARGLDVRGIRWPRVLDMNDRALREVVLGLGGKTGGVPRQGRFDITAASEVMAVLCLAADRADLRRRLGRMIVGVDGAGRGVTAEMLEADGAMALLLDQAIEPNLVQTTEGGPAIVHGGPFANIAHGCSSLLATKLSLQYADWVVTEAGFGFDLGGEKFLDIKARVAGLDVAAVVVVATVRALRVHGGGAVDQADSAAVAAGLPNLARHLDSVDAFGLVPVVALNHFAGDTEAEVAAVEAFCEARGVAFSVSRHFAAGGEGAAGLGETVVAAADPRTPRYSYALEAPLESKMRAIAERVYGARDVTWSPSAARARDALEAEGMGDWPICVAKTPMSLSDDPSKVGRPTDFDISVAGIYPQAGAGFHVVLTGDVMRMPGLPRRPRALEMAPGTA